MHNKPQIIKLPSGLELISAPRFEHIESVCLELTVRVGGRMEDDNHYGLAHFVEHLVAHAVSKQLRTHEWISNYIMRTFDASTDQEKTIYSMAALSSDLALCIDCLTKVILPKSLISQITEEDIIREKSIINEEYLSYLDEDNTDTKLALAKVFYGDNTLARGEVLGSQESIAWITLDDVHKFIDQYYRTANAFLCVVGNVDYDALPDLVTKYLSTETTTAAILPTIQIDKPANIRSSRILHHQDTVQNTLITMKQVDIGSVKDAVALLFITEMLREYLEYQGRDKGLFYSISVYYLPFLDHFDLVIDCSFSPEKTTEIEGWIKTAITDFEKVLTYETFTAFRETMINNTRIEFTYPKTMLDTITWYYFYCSEPVSLRDELGYLKSLTLDDVSGIFEKTFQLDPEAIVIAGRLDR